MKFIRKITLFVITHLFILTTLFSQFETGLPRLIINEIGYNSADDKTYIELLVLGNRENEIIDISNWTLDNYSAGNEEDEYLIRFSNYFNQIKSGTLIIIYDPQNPFRELNDIKQAIDNNTLDQVVLVPIDSDIIDILHSDDYQPLDSRGRNTITNWRNTIGLSRANNGLFVSNPQGIIETGIAWTITNNPMGRLPGVTNVGRALPSGNVSLGAGTLCPSSISIQVGLPGTPGVPNNQNNVNSVNGHDPNFSITCRSDAPPGALGLIQGRIDFLGGIAPYNIVVKNAQGDIHWENTSSNSFVNVPGSLGETYQVTVTDSRGCIEKCSYTIANSTDQVTTCESQPIEIGEVNSAECFKWEPTIGLSDPNATLTYASPAVTTTYTLLISDGCGQITSRKEYRVEVHEVEDVEILSSPDPAIVFDQEVFLSTTGSWVDYEWVAEFTTTPTNEPTFIISPADFLNGLQGYTRVYEVNVTDDNGCTNSAEITVGLDSDGDGISDDEDCNPNNPVSNIDTDGDGVCDEIDCDPNSILIGGIGSPCNDYNASTINDVIINDNCDCQGTPDASNACNGNDQDGDGVCDGDDPAPYNPCVPNSIDSDGDGYCDAIDCFPNDFNQAFAIGEPCDDQNISTLHDQINANCICSGIPDINDPCNGNDQDGDGLCDGFDPIPEDPCNGLTVEISGDLTLCGSQQTTELTADIEGGISPFDVEWSIDKTTISIVVNAAQSSNYSVTVTDYLGCSVEAEVALTYYTDCDDEPCEVELPASNVNLQIPQGIFTTTAARSDYDCDLEAVCIDGENGKVVCVNEYVPIKFKNTGTCSYPIDPLQVLVDGIAQIMEILEDRDGINRFGSAAITSNDFLCHCEVTNDELIQQYEKNVHPDEVGVWINFTDSPDSDDPSYEVYIIGFDPIEFPIQDYLLQIEQSEDGLLPTGGIVHNSQLNGLFDPQLVTSPYTGTNYGSLIDYANLDPTTKDIILANANHAESRFGIKTKFITSADCISVTNPDESLIASSEKAKAEFESSIGNGVDLEIVYWLHKNAANQVMLDIKINGNIILNNDFHQNVDLSFYKQAIEDALYEVAARDQKPMEIPIDSPNLAPDETYFNGNGTEWNFGFREGAPSSEKNFWGITKAVGGVALSSLKQGQVDDQVWKSDSECLFDIMGLIAGPIDGFLEANPVASGIQVVGLVKSAAQEPEVRQALWQAAKHPIKTTKEMFEEEWNNAAGNNGKEQQHYTIGKLTTTTTISLLSGAGFLALIDNLSGDPKLVGQKLTQKLKDFPQQAADHFYERVNQLIPDKADVEKWLTFMEELGEFNWRVLIDNPDLLNIWIKFRDLGADQLAKFEKVFKIDMPITNPAFIDKLKEVFVRIDNSVVEIKESIVRFVDDLDNGSDDFKGLFNDTPEAVDAWESLLPDETLRRDPEKLIKVKTHSDDFDRSFTEIGDEFTDLPPAQRAGWVDHLEYRTNGSKVNKAGGNDNSVFNSFQNNSDVPARYSDEARFNDLATDHGPGGSTSQDASTRREAMAGMEAESQGLIDGPISRDQTGDFEFIDSNGDYWDVKGPPSIGMNTPAQVTAAANSIKSQLLAPALKGIILDCSWMTTSQLSALRAQLTPAELQKIIEVNSNLF